MSDWFPDYLATWYDQFASQAFDPSIAKLRNRRPRQVDIWEQRLIEDPHGTAADIDDSVRKSASLATLYVALQAASSAIERVGFFCVRDAAPSWTSLRLHWRANGTLTSKASPGIVIPRRERPYPWMPRRSVRKLHDIGSHFRGFLRLPIGKAHQIDDVVIRVMPDLVGRPEVWRDSLTIAFAPLVDRMDELKFEPIDGESGLASFRVALVNETGMLARAEVIVGDAARQGADIIIFPELCFTTATQCALAQGLRALKGAPYLMLAGSSHSPSPDSPGNYNNRALLYGEDGQELLRHNKLFPYEISEGELQRYGLRDALGCLDRVEDIVALPRRLEILETALGRLGVLICEDLSVVETFDSVVKQLEIDWLLVPVMDGAQTAERWTAKFAQQYARSGCIVVVCTCGALVEAHRERELVNDRPDPGAFVGLMAHPANRTPTLVPGRHAEPSTVKI